MSCCLGGASGVVVSVVFVGCLVVERCVGHSGCQIMSSEANNEENARDLKEEKLF